MKSETTKIEILENNKEILNKYLDKFNTNIIDIIYLDSYIIISISKSFINKFSKFIKMKA